MEFKQDELDLIQNYWLEVSQDPDWISKDSGINLDKVIEILKKLSNEKLIKNFHIDNISEVMKFDRWRNL